MKTFTYIWKYDKYQIKEDVRNVASMNDLRENIQCNEEISEAIPKEARSPRVHIYKSYFLLFDDQRGIF